MHTQRRRRSCSPAASFDILEEIEKRIPGFPIVLHGASSVIPKYVKIINENGGHMPDAVGIPEDQLRRAAKSSVCKINIDSDLRLAMTAGIREHFKKEPSHFDPRQYLTIGRSYIKDLVTHKIKEVLGSDGKALEIQALINQKQISFRLYQQLNHSMTSSHYLRWGHVFVLYSCAYGLYWTLPHFSSIMVQQFTSMGIISIHRGTLYGINCEKIWRKLCGNA